MRKDKEAFLSRRRILELAGAGAGFALAACGSDELTSTNNTSSNNNQSSCTLTPAEIEGPFFADLQLMRRDIAGGKAGQAIQFQLTVVDANTCLPIPDAAVDLWHADAGGLYSAFPGQGDGANIDTSGQSFLRGIQTTDINGLVTFDSIYPGWYSGRTTHVHIKVRLANRTAVTSQLYFPDSVSATVYGAGEYLGRGQKDTSNEVDQFSATSSQLQMTLTIANNRYLATHTIGINRSS